MNIIGGKNESNIIFQIQKGKKNIHQAGPVFAINYVASFFILKNNNNNNNNIK